ncbi:alanine:cation symporter family protein [Alkalihalobacillus sp. TS-13]|uniref:alanine:cation symporter family protein n=1 Tax=Alkalihalobacillus sp. TS-13 TaxID=2842455 RepID=UPI001C87EB56|nr:alanine:cation symporter family protein [Alkalihalobacillus sp. TS-13]
MVIFGVLKKVELVWILADLFRALMAIVNLVAIFLLGEIAFAVLKDYMNQKREGKDPIFVAAKFPFLKNVEWWGGSIDQQKTENQSQVKYTDATVTAAGIAYTQILSIFPIGVKSMLPYNFLFGKQVVLADLLKRASI